jgi:hypothetical protein
MVAAWPVEHNKPTITTARPARQLNLILIRLHVINTRKDIFTSSRREYMQQAVKSILLLFHRILQGF